MSDNPYWVGMVMALSQYPGVQALARKAQEREVADLRRSRLARDSESELCPPGMISMVTAQRAKDLARELEKARKRWSRQPSAWLFRPIEQGSKPHKPPQAPVGERIGDGKVTFLLRADLEGELNTGLNVSVGQCLIIDVQGNCRLSPTLLTNPGGIEIKHGRPRGNPITRSDATYPNVPCGSVVALIGDFYWPIRGHWAGTCSTSGPLRLAINDVPGHYKDNRAPGGEIVVLAVTVEV